MPICFNLTPKGQTEPELLPIVDDKMRAHLGEDPNPDQWYADWKHSIGIWFAATNVRGEELRKELETSFGSMPDRLEELFKALDFIESNYEIKNWRA